MFKNVLMTVILAITATSSLAASPSKKQSVETYAQLEKHRQQDVSCIINKTGIVMSDNLSSIVKQAVSECVTPTGNTITYMKNMAQKSAKVKNYKATPKDIQSMVNTTQEIYQNMAIMSIELCAGLEKNTPKECLAHIQKLNTSIELP